MLNVSKECRLARQFSIVPAQVNKLVTIPESVTDAKQFRAVCLAQTARTRYEIERSVSGPQLIVIVITLQLAH